jgi:protein involved in polysaccharide export with SLBB domain
VKFILVNGFFIILLYFCSSMGQAVQPYSNQEEKEIPAPETPKIFDIDILTPEKSIEKILPAEQYLEQALDAEIDSSSYILGPGDLLLINIWGPLSNQVMSQITAEGYVVIPEITDVKVAGLSLANGSELIRNTLDKYFKDTHFTIRLMRLRKIRVYVTGEVENPGAYFVRGVDRLGDLIELADGLSSGADDTRIQITHLSGVSEEFDYNQFYRFGDRDANPLLLGGDVVYIPTVDMSRDYVIIEGNIESQGIYRLKQGETLYEIMQRMEALNRENDIQNVTLVRGNNQKYFNLLTDLESARNEVLSTGDKVYIQAIREYVYVQGEVDFPGAYPYMANFTSKDYAGMGGLRETAQSIDKIEVVHVLNGSKEKGGNVIVQKGDMVVVPQRRRENTKDVLAILTPIFSITISTIALIVASQ